TIATVSMVYGASFNPFNDIPALKNLHIPIDKDKFNFDLDTGSSGGNTGGGNTGGGNTGGDTCKVDNSQKGTHFYCFTTSGKNTHHHCDPKDPVNVKSGLCKKT
ncbi:MAG: hypothetical protein ACTHKK_00545, partial [Candidatus Nitrosocosmicus sp.]